MAYRVRTTRDLDEWAAAASAIGHYFGWQPTEDVRAALVFSNIFDKQYTVYNADDPAPGFSVKGTLSVRLGMK